MTTTQKARTKRANTPITVDAKALAAALRRVSSFACTDSTLPPINGVRIEYRSGAVFLAATDRFKLAAERVFCLYPDRSASDRARAVPDFAALIPLDAINTVLTHLTRDREIRTVDLTSPRDGMIEIGQSLAYSDTPGTGPFPNWRSVAHDALAEAPGDASALSWVNPQLVKPFLKLNFGSEAVRLRLPANPTRPLIAVVPDTFFAMIMPMRITEAHIAQIGEAFGLSAAPEPEPAPALPIDLKILISHPEDGDYHLWTPDSRNPTIALDRTGRRNGRLASPSVHDGTLWRKYRCNNTECPAAAYVRADAELSALAAAAPVPTRRSE